jgi:hypothetical protein
MKKIIAILFVMSLIAAIPGCGGGGGNNDKNDDDNGSPSTRTGYYYMWSSNIVSTSAYAKPLSIFNSVVYADEPTKYLGSETPPFSSLDDGGRVSGTLLLFTYYNGAQVRSTCTCDPNVGEIVDYALNGDGSYTVPSFAGKKEGLFSVTAVYNGEILNIPVRIYHFGIIDLDHIDLDGDGINDIQDLCVIYGYQVINNGYLSLISSAPTGEYTQNTSLTEFIYGKIYIIKTSSGKYCKVYPTGYCGENDYNSINFLSDNSGNFDY